MFRRCIVILATSWFLATSLLTAKGKKQDAPGSKEVGTSLSDGAIFQRQGEGKAWVPVKEGQTLHAGDLLLGIAGAALKSGNGAVRLSFIGDLAANSPFPIIESAVVLGRDSKFDLTFILDRGRVDLTNIKEKGPAQVKFHLCRGTFELVLDESGTRVALETYGRWLKGQPFPKDDPKAQPCRSLVVLVLKGHATVKNNDQEFALSAPPGPAMIQWDNLSNEAVKPQRLDQLPDWAQVHGPQTPEAMAKKHILARFRQRVQEKGLAETLNELLESDNPLERRLAVYGMGATDDLKGLAKALLQAKQPDVWDNGVIALRHWIGRSDGQDMKLYRGLIEQRKMSSGQAEIVLQLLHSFSDEDLALPETYELLIDYLDHDVLGIRGLAAWHLKRLVPAGKDIKYHPTDPKEDRDRAQKEWRKLIPRGKLPPHVKTQAD